MIPDSEEDTILRGDNVTRSSNSRAWSLLKRQQLTNAIREVIRSSPLVGTTRKGYNNDVHYYHNDNNYDDTIGPMIVGHTIMNVVDKVPDMEGIEKDRKFHLSSIPESRGSFSGEGDVLNETQDSWRRERETVQVVRDGEKDGTTTTATTATTTTTTNNYGVNNFAVSNETRQFIERLHRLSRTFVAEGDPLNEGQQSTSNQGSVSVTTMTTREAHDDKNKINIPTKNNPQIIIEPIYSYDSDDDDDDEEEESNKNAFSDKEREETAQLKPIDYIMYLSKVTQQYVDCNGFATMTSPVLCLAPNTTTNTSKATVLKTAKTTAKTTTMANIRHGEHDKKADEHNVMRKGKDNTDTQFDGIGNRDRGDSRAVPFDNDNKNNTKDEEEEDDGTEFYANNNKNNTCTQSMTCDSTTLYNDTNIFDDTVAYTSCGDSATYDHTNYNDSTHHRKRLSFILTDPISAYLSYNEGGFLDAAAKLIDQMNPWDSNILADEIIDEYSEYYYNDDDYGGDVDGDGGNNGADDETLDVLSTVDESSNRHGGGAVGGGGTLFSQTVDDEYNYNDPESTTTDGDSYDDITLDDTHQLDPTLTRSSVPYRLV